MNQTCIVKIPGSPTSENIPHSIEKRLKMLAALLFLFCVMPGLVVAGECDNKNVDFDRGETISHLRAGGFTGALNQKIELTKNGKIKYGSVCFEVFTYVYTSKAKGEESKAIHMAKRLLIFSDSQYVGMYVIDELPTAIKGNAVQFPGEKTEGNSIVFDSATAPDKVYLGGEVRRLYK